MPFRTILPATSDSRFSNIPVNKLINTSSNGDSFESWKNSQLTPDYTGMKTMAVTEPVKSVTKPLQSAINETMAGNYAATRGSFNAISTLNPFNFRPQEFEKEVNKGLTSPISLNGENINPNRANSSGGVDVGATAKSWLGTGLKGTAGAFNVGTMGSTGIAPRLAQQFKSNFMAGAGTSIADDLKKDTGAFETALNAGISGLAQGGISSLPKTLSTFRGWRAQAAGIDDLGQEVLANPKNAKPVLNAVEQAKKSMKDVRVSSPLETAGQKIENAYKSNLKPTKKVVGQQIGDALDNVKKEINIEPAKNKFVQSLKKLGVKVTNGVIDTSESAFASNEAARKQIEKLGAEFYGKKSMKATALFNRIRDLRDVIGLSKENPSAIGATAKKPIKDFISSLDDILKTSVPDVKAPIGRYRELSKADKFLSKTTGDNKAASNIFKRLYATGRTKQLLPTLDELSRLSNTDLINESNVAKTAMDIVGDPRARSLLQTTSIKEMPTNVKKGVIETISNALIRPEGAAKGLMKEAGALPDVTKRILQALRPLYLINQGRTKSLK